MVNIATVKLLKEVPNIFPSVTLSKHEKRLAAVAGIRVGPRIDTQDKDTLKWLNFTRKAGFRSIVDADWALRFKYHASVFGHTVCEDLSMREDHSQSWYWYNGDIPEFALDALEVYKKAERKYFPLQVPSNVMVTLHSMERLPIKITKSLPANDPVMIGWEKSPVFTLGPSGWGANRDYYLGVIIAAWDEYKEVVDYKVKASDLTLQ